MDHGKAMARLGLGAILAVAVAGELGLRSHARWLPDCPFHHFLHLYCPGCGSTRMVNALLHGELLVALRCNAMALLMAPPLLYELVRLSLARPAWMPALPSPNWGGRAILVGVLLFWGLRNVPFMPFAWLAPVEVGELRAPGR